MSVYPLIKMPALATGKLHVAKIASYNDVCLHARRHRHRDHAHVKSKLQTRRVRILPEGHITEREYITVNLAD